MKTEIEVLMVHDDPRHGFRFSRERIAATVSVPERPQARSGGLPVHRRRSTRPVGAHYCREIYRPIETGW